MASLNRVQLIGRLGKDPEVRFTPNGKKVCKFSLAVDRRWKSADGQVQKETDWMLIEAWGKLAETCENYAQKGQLVYVEGRLRTEQYESQGETKYITKIILSTLQFLEWRGERDELPELDEELPVE